MWAYESVFYQIYPLGFCSAPFENNGVQAENILKIRDWIPHLKSLNVNAIYLSPIFESDTHGYNTRDYRLIDKRLGTNEDFRTLVQSLHDNGIRVVIDGVFNHVGRGFFAFQDVCANRSGSRYAGWFHISFDGNSNYNDGFWYEGWEGNYDLVKLNLNNPEVVDYLLESVSYWIDYFDIDGIRLDVAYMLNENFMRRLRGHCDSKKEDFFLLGEMIHGDYNRLLAPDMLHSVTNYEAYKGLHSSFNSMNMFEINHSLIREFGSDPWCLYTGRHLLSFVDNHDVSRIASTLNNSRHLPLIYAMLAGMPGIPCIYYGSEWGITGDKKDGDPALRPAIDNPVSNELSETVASFMKLRHTERALNYGGFRSVLLTNRQCIFERRVDDERVFVLINADENDFDAYADFGTAELTDLVSGDIVSGAQPFRMKGYEARFLKAK
ncbi:MAG: cyclomaltodextrinase [Lachnospiraceae bacterium]|nr:cyclomaltodextrinase [Lachnospiraceae bacterium]